MSSSAVGPAPTRTAAPPHAPWRGLPDLARPFVVVAAIVVWTLLVNLPTFARQDADDADSPPEAGSCALDGVCHVRGFHLMRQRSWSPS